MRVDGADTDWRDVRTGWTGDSTGAGRGGAAGATGDITLLKLAVADGRLFIQVVLDGASSWDRPVQLLLDTVPRSAGPDRAPIVLHLRGASAAGGRSEAVVSGAERGVRGHRKVTGEWGPRFAAPGRSWAEFSFPLADLGLRAGQPIHFRARGGRARKFLKGAAKYGIPYRLGAAMSMDGHADDWTGVPSAWVDPEGDAAPPEDLRVCKMASDSAFLYLHCRWAGAAGKGGRHVRIDIDPLAGPLSRSEDEIRIDLSTAAGSSARKRPAFPPSGLASQGNPQDTAGGVFPAGISFPPDCGWLEAALPWEGLGLAPGRKFRFALRSLPSGDALQGFEDARASLLHYPSRTLHLGAQMFGLAPGTLDSVLTGYKRTLMGGEPFAAGDYFNVRLAVHGEDGSYMSDRTFPGVGRYDFTELRGILDAFRRQGVAYFPLIPYHYLPSWFERRHDSLYGDTRMISRTGSKAPAHAFLSVIPDAVGIREWANGFTRAAVGAMSLHLGETVPMILAGNEPMYPGDRKDAFSYDTAFTLKEWRRYMKKPALALPESSSAEFSMFRSSRLTDLIRGWTEAGSLASRGLIPVSAKLVPYGYFSGKFRQNGYFPHIFDYLNWSGLPVIASDAYGPTAEDLQRTYRLGKPIVLGEYSLPAPARKVPARQPDRATVSDWLVDGVSRYGVEGAFFFSWNAENPAQRIHPEQVEGIKDAISRLLRMPKPPIRNILVKCLLPIDSTVLAGSTAMAAPDVIEHMLGWTRLATDLQATRSDVAVELDYRIGDCAPDLLIRTVTDSLVLSPEEAAGRRAVYLLKTPGAFVRAGAMTVRSAGVVGNAGNSSCRLVDTRFSAKPGSVIMSWSPAWFAGCKRLEFDSAGTAPAGYKVVAEADGKPVIVQAGPALFVAGNPLWRLGHGDGDAALSRFLVECALRLLAP